MGETVLVQELKKEIEGLKKVIKTYENIMRLSDTEVANSDEIIRMYEQMVEYSAMEIRQLQETIKANELVFQYSDFEREANIKKISELLEQNKKLKEERSVIK